MKAVEFAILLKDKAGSTISSIAKEFGNAKIKADKLTGSVDVLNSKLGRVGSGLKDAFMSLPGAQFLSNPIVAIGMAGAAVAKLGIENDKANVSFEVLLQSEKKAADLLGLINEYADKTPYEKMGLRDAAKMMLGFGIAQEKIMPNLKMIGDIAMGDANKMNSLTLAFSQMSSAGKLNGQDLLQMINAGFNPLNEISKMTGKSIGELRKEMEAGKISSQMVENAFKSATSAGGIFNGMTKRIGKELGGKLSTLVDSLKNRMLELYQIIKPVLVPAVDLLLIVIDNLGKPIKWLITLFTGFLNKLKEGNPLIWALIIGITAYSVAANGMAIITGIVTMVTKGWAIAQMLLNAVLTANPIGLVVMAIAALVTFVVLAWQKLGWFRGAVMASWEAIKGFGLMIKDFVIDRIKGILTGLSGLGKAIMQFFQGDFKGAWQSAKNATKDLLGIDAARNAVGKFKQIGKNSAEAYRAGVDAVTAKKAKKDGIITGTDTPWSAAGVNGSGSGTGTTGGTATQTVAGGGTRNTSINISVGKMVESIIFQRGDVKDNREQLTKELEEVFMRLLYAAESAS